MTTCPFYPNTVYRFYLMNFHIALSCFVFLNHKSHHGRTKLLTIVCETLPHMTLADTASPTSDLFPLPPFCRDDGSGPQTCHASSLHSRLFSPAGHSSSQPLFDQINCIHPLVCHPKCHFLRKKPFPTIPSVCSHNISLLQSTYHTKNLVTYEAMFNILFSPLKQVPRR